MPVSGTTQRFYNKPMDLSVFERIKASIGFGREDMDRLHELGPLLTPHLPLAIQRFYERLFADDKARAVFTGGQAQIQRQFDRLVEWMRTLFCGEYDQRYLDERLAIGRTHVSVGLPQHYMPVAMEMLRQELVDALKRAKVPDSAAASRTLDKALSIDLAIMMESYKASYSDQIRDEERAVVEERLTRSEHLAQIGQLAASLAHEIKNPLAGISGAIQVLRDGIPKDSPNREIIGEILAQIGRLDATVKDLLVFARPRRPAFGACDLQLVITRVVRLMNDTPAFRGVVVRVNSPKDLPAVAADDVQMEQLAMNLLLNAAHASKRGELVAIEFTDGGETVRMTVADRGKGMDEATLQKAFEPFFTTKAKGTGLGLSICRKIVEAHRGTMSLTSAPNAGTQVVIEIPKFQSRDKARAR